MKRVRVAALLAVWSALAAPWAHAGLPRLCSTATELTADQKDRRLQLAAAVKHELERSGGGVALVSRSGVDLARFGQRYSHAGVSLRANPNTPWSVRQLYYACDEARPRLFDQGLAGFLLAADDAPGAFVSIVLLPDDAAAALEQTALDTATALQLLGSQYSANAFPFSVRYQNCNQWVAELLAAAWGGPATRDGAQQWLQDSGYAPVPFDLGSRLMVWLASLVPFVHTDDHPAADLDAARLQVSMPAALEAFVRRRLPSARRIELCQDDRHVVVREGWQPLDQACTAGPGDRVLPFDAIGAAAAEGG